MFERKLNILSACQLHVQLAHELEFLRCLLGVVAIDQALDYVDEVVKAEFLVGDKELVDFLKGDVDGGGFARDEEIMHLLGTFHKLAYGC